MKGRKFEIIIFDDLTHLTESQYLYLFSRCKENMAKFLFTRIRPSIGHSWVRRKLIVMKRLAWSRLALLAITAVFIVAAARVGEQRSYVVRWQTASFLTNSTPEPKNQFSRSATDTLGSVRGLRRDTTAVFEIRPYMSAKVLMTSAATDSAAQTFILYTSSDTQFRRGLPAWSHFTAEDSVVATGETMVRWLITDGAISTDKYGFIVARGNAANCKTEAVTDRILLTDWQQ